MVFQSNEECSMADNSTRAAKARSELISRHGEVLRASLGDNFEQHPRFEQAVNEVAAGRAPQFVLMDLQGMP